VGFFQNRISDFLGWDMIVAVNHLGGYLGYSNKIDFVGVEASRPDFWATNVELFFQITPQV